MNELCLTIFFWKAEFSFTIQLDLLIDLLNQEMAETEPFRQREAE